MSGIKLKITTVETHRFSGTISADDLRKALDLPKDAQLTVHGSYSGDQIDIDKDCPLYVSWEKVVEATP